MGPLVKAIPTDRFRAGDMVKYYGVDNEPLQLRGGVNLAVVRGYTESSGFRWLDVKWIRTAEEVSRLTKRGAGDGGWSEEDFDLAGGPGRPGLVRQLDEGPIKVRRVGIVDRL